MSLDGGLVGVHQLVPRLPQPSDFVKVLPLLLGELLLLALKLLLKLVSLLPEPLVLVLDHLGELIGLSSCPRNDPRNVHFSKLFLILNRVVKLRKIGKDLVILRTLLVKGRR